MKLENNWKYKSLLNLFKAVDSSSTEYQTKLTARCHQLLSLPLNEYTIEDLRLMISQQFGLTYLIPFAIEKLHNDLFAEGDFYSGDLLAAVFKIAPSFWKENQKLWGELDELIGPRKNEIINEGISLQIFEDSSQL